MPEEDFHKYLDKAEYLISHGYTNEDVISLAKKLQRIDEEKLKKSSN